MLGQSYLGAYGMKPETAPPPVPEAGPPATRRQIKREARKGEATRAMNQPYELTAPEYEYQYGGAPVPPPAAKEWAPIFPTVWGPQQVINTQSVYPEVSLNEVEYLASSYPVGDEDSLNTQLRLMNEQRAKDKEDRAKGEKVEPAEERARKIGLYAITAARTRAGMPEGVTLTDQFVSSKLTDYGKALIDILEPYLKRPEMIGKYDNPQDYDDAVAVWKGLLRGDINMVAVASDDFKKERHGEMAKVVIAPVVGTKHPDDWTVEDINKMNEILQAKYPDSYESAAEYIRDYFTYYPYKPKPPAPAAPLPKSILEKKRAGAKAKKK
jgi:hypothetical protein